MINYYIVSSELIVLTFVLICFARLYYWFDFSPESGFQTLFILGLIPLNWMIKLLGFSDYVPQVLCTYLLLLITLGALRIFLTKYTISNTCITVQLILIKSFELDHSRTLELKQHARGRLLNFGCILVPIVELKNPKKYFISTLLFQQRYSATFSGFLRMDGIRNPVEVIQTLINKFKNENR